MNNISFEGSFPSEAKAPKFDIPEFAFIGRSNVGKSSLINYICERKNLARTSGTPGKTQLINLYNIDQHWVLADLPGYGYAKISKKLRQKFSVMIKDYLRLRKNLFTAFQLIDIRHPPQPLDLENINWLGEHRIPFAIVFTKSDKLKPDELEENIELFCSELSKTWEILPDMFVTSATRKIGADRLIKYIETCIEQ